MYKFVCVKIFSVSGFRWIQNRYRKTLVCIKDSSMLYYGAQYVLRFSEQKKMYYHSVE